MTQNPQPRIEIYDTTLRDGTQGEGISLSLTDKLNIASKLDALGVDYIEGGYPLSNPKDVAFFQETAKMDFQHAKICAFGMTRRKDIQAKDDPGMKALVDANTSIITIVGKTWDLHVQEVLRVTLEENLAMIQDSVQFCVNAGKEVFYDAEHFFDGSLANADYAWQTLRAALRGGASKLILCDTNGGSLPGQIVSAMAALNKALQDPSVKPNSFALGIHTHNDCGLAIANGLAAVQAGATQVQGTINGIGERCGNADLTTIIANLKLKMDYDCLDDRSLSHLTQLSRYVAETANMSSPPGQPFVGRSAFAHKGGMHVHAVQRVAHSYEHVAPEQVGNTRRILVSELSGSSNIAATLGKKFNIQTNKQAQQKVLSQVQDLEHQGYQFEAATASFELLLHHVLGTRPDYWSLDHYRCVILKRSNENAVTEASVKLNLCGHVEHRVAEGDGPVNALDSALRKCLETHYPQLQNIHLRDYKVRVVNPTAQSAAKVRVIAQFQVKNQTGPTTHFATVGVNENIVDASWEALNDAFCYHLIESQVPAS